MKFIRFKKAVKFNYKPLEQDVMYRDRDLTLLENDIADKLVAKGVADFDDLCKTATKKYNGK